MSQRAALSLVARARGVSLLGCVQTGRRGKVVSHIWRATQGRGIEWVSRYRGFIFDVSSLSLLGFGVRQHDDALICVTCHAINKKSPPLGGDEIVSQTLTAQTRLDETIALVRVSGKSSSKDSRRR